VEISDEQSAGRTQDFPFNATLTGIQRPADTLAGWLFLWLAGLDVERARLAWS
jgi:hypothetical protein